MVVSGCLHYWIVTSVLFLSSSRQCNGTATTMPFSASPANISVDRGGNVSFNCTYPNVAAGVNIFWNGPGVEEDDDTCTMPDSMETDTKTCTLMITNVSNSHAGKYFCTARFNNGTMVKSTAGTLSVNYMTVRFKLDVIIASENQSIEVPVNVTVFGSPINNPYLLLRYGEAASSMNKAINKTNGTQNLQISTIQLTCTTSPVQVTATTDDPLVELQGSNIVSIHIVPTIGFNKSNSYSVVEGDTVRVCVTVMCGQLLQNETVMLSIINNTARAGIDFIAPEQMTITLTPSSESDCIMIMTIFDDYQTSMDKQFQIEILMQPSASTESDSPVVYMPDTTNITITNLPLPSIMPSEKKVSTGETTGFQVNANFTVVKFQWLHNNMNITNEKMRYSGIKTNNLTVMNIVNGDAGNYSCNVTTEFDLTVTSQQARLQVFAIPIITAGPVNITVNRNKADLVFFNVTLNKALGEEFTYQWQRNDLVLREMPGKIEGVNTSVLMIIDPRNEDEGSYQCVIVNGAGDSVTSDKAFLSVVDLPAMPVITNVSASSTSITINWSQNLSSDVFWYELRYNFTIEECYSENNVSKWIDMINGSLTSYTLTNSSETPIEEDSAYSIFLTAVNWDGRSEASTTEISTLGAAPTGTPINLNQTVVNDREITIQWEPVKCSQRNGEIIGYNVTYYPAGENSMQKFVVIHASVGTFTAMGLVFNTMYVFEVQAINSYGTGPPANANVQTSALQGIVIVYDGRSYQNNSIVNLDAEGGILQCFTNKIGCCKPSKEGEWKYPNGSLVEIRGSNWDFYRMRDNNPGVVTLHWIENAMIPEGVFCCEITKIPPSQFACIGVYSEGAGFPMVVSITVDPVTKELVCTSTGGPATTVIWKVNNQITNGSIYQQRQRIASHQNATFQNILRIPIYSIANYNATYECLVMNSVGNDSLSFRLEAIEIVSENLSVGDNGSLSCKSIIIVEIMEWLNSDGEVIASLTDTRRLNLTFAPVNTSINNQMYTCRVNKSASVNKTITISVTVEDPLEVMIGGPSSVVDIGEIVAINCTATTIVGVSQLPTLTLTHPNGINLIRTEGELASIILDPVEVEDAGEYTCMGEIDLENITSAIVQVEQNITFKLPTPMIDVAYDESSLEVGSSTVLNCTVTNYSIDNFDASLNITWSRSGIVLSNDSDRVVILNIEDSSTSTSQLTLSPLSANDDNITCSVNVELATPNSFIEMTPTVSKQVQLTIEEPDVMVQIASGSTLNFEGRNESAGTNFSLICMVGSIENFRPELSFEWNHSNGTGFEEINITSNEIHFSPLKLSEAGIYMCQVNIRSSLLRSDLSLVSMPPYIVRAFVPNPVVTAILPPQDIFVGSSPSVTCVAEFDESVDLPLNIMIIFTIDQTITNSIHSVHMENYMRYTRTFTIDNIQANQMGACSSQSSYSGLEPSEFILDNPMDNPMDIAYASVNISINAAIITEITSSGENIVGEKYNLTCTVVINGTHDTPRVNITWNSTIPTDTISYDNETYISALQFDPLQESHRDYHQCSVAVADIVDEESFYLNVQVPTVYATLNGGTPVVGEPYTLSCNVSGDEKLDSSVTYQWMRYNEIDMETLLEANSDSEILSFSSLNLSDSGNYSCSAVIRSSYLDNSISANSNLVSIILQAPPPSSVMLMSLTGNIFAGKVFSVACTVCLPPTVDIAVNVNIEWNEPADATLNYTSPMMMDNPNEYTSVADVVSNVQSETISFQCAASVDSVSSFITASESRAANASVLVVGRPSQPIGLNVLSVGSTNIELTWSRSDGDIVYGYELQYEYHIRQCPRNTPGMMRSINISNSTNSHTLEDLEEDSEFNISLIAFNPAGRSHPANVVATTLSSAPSGAPQNLTATYVDFTNITIEWDPVECSERNGEIDGYRLIYHSTMNSDDNGSTLIDGSNTNTFTIVGLQPRAEYTLTLGAVGGSYTLFNESSSTSISKLTSTPQMVGFLFNGKVYGNNSIVSLTEIGEGRNSLLCITNIDECCVGRNPATTRQWYFPNGTQVEINGMGGSIYRDRGLSIVRLNRRHNTTSPTGIFRCIIPSSTGSINNMYIGIYHDGQGAPSITSFTYSRSSVSLNCMSTGGPVTRVIWRLNNQPLMIDGTRYQQIQTIIDTENATYTNILQSDDNRNLVGMFTCIVQNARGSDSMTISTNGVVINNTADNYTVGINITITCRSDTATERMEWLTNETVIVSGTMTMQLDLDFTPVNDSVHDRVYICRVTRSTDEIAEQNFTMNVTVPAANRVLNLNIIPMRNTGIAGESISFMCIVTKNISGLKQQPLAVWVENGTELTEQSESNATLTFDKLNTSDGKVYTCRGTISSPALSTPRVVMQNHSLIVQIPTPSINVTLSSNTVYAGTNLSVICDISINTAVDSDISVNVTWFNESAPISTETDRVSVLPLDGNKPSFTSDLLIHPLIDVDNTSNFSCQASVHSDSAFIERSNTGKGFIHIPVQQRTPSEPKIVIENVTSTGIDLRWSQETHDFIKGFTITATYMAPCNDFSNNIIPHKFSHSALTRRANIAGLQEFSSYSIVITAFNNAGNNSSNKTITTNSSEPTGSPNDIRNTSVNLTSVAISWSPISCIEQNSIIHEYIVYYRKRLQDGSRNDNISTMMTNATINNLDPRTNYEFEVQGINENGQKGPSEKLNVTTSAPTAVGLLFHDSHHGNKSVVSLDEIGEGADALLCLTNSLSCCEEHGDDGTTGGMWYFPDSMTSPVPLENQSSEDDNTMYITRGPGVVGLHRRGSSMMPVGIFRCDVPDEGGKNQSIYIGVYPAVQGKGAVEVQNLRFDKGKQALSCTSTGGPPTTVTWRKNGERLNIDGSTHNQTQIITDASSSIFVTTLVINYRPDLNEIVGNYTCMVDNSRVTNVGTNLRTFEIQGLKIAEYESSLPHGSSVHLNCSTDLAADTIEWLDTNGEVLKRGNGPSLQLIHTPSGVTNVVYICRINSTFGSQNKTANVHILQEEVSPSDSDSLIVIAIVVVVIALVIVVIVIIVAILLMRRKRQGKLSLFSGRVNSKSHSRSVVQAITPLKEKSRDTKKKAERLEMTTYKKYKGAVVSVDHFNNYVRNMHGDRDQQFENEYSTISKEPLHSYASSEIMVNRLRNRFGNIFPYDHSRVKLKEQAGVEHSDYINANYLDGYQKPSAYIAAQGPLPNTLDDFWRMIWEKRLTTIVMLTQCFEGKKKCECYWPININEAFEPGEGIKVILTSMVPFTEYIIRKMTVTRVTEPQAMPLEVIQFHFVAWPDHGVPDNHALMLNFVRRVRKLHPYSNPCPLLVHCSAGVGRTGTFIVLDTMLERMEGEGTLNIYDYVKQLREQRVLMVQTLTQYIFIHDALSEFITYGLTEIAATDIRKVINELNLQHDPCSASTGFEHQFQDLGRTNQMTSAPSPDDDQYSVATSEENKEKNRYSNKLPNNFYRVCLKSTPSSDYINASFIDGYKQRKAYIATQGPLESTVCDFWRMVWENESKCVVLLSELKENGEEMCVCCWPTTLGTTQTYGHITVKLLAEENYGNYDLRKFEISEDKIVHPGVQGVNTAFTVTQLHFLVWPEHETPPITSSLIELVENVNKVQMGAGNKPMIIMCNDGVGRTGTFICIHAQLERLKTEGVVDFFQFIKSVRMHRAGLVSNAAQYSLCHEVVANYLDSFDTYANFKEVI